MMIYKVKFIFHEAARQNREIFEWSDENKLEWLLNFDVFNVQVATVIPRLSLSFVNVHRVPGLFNFGPCQLGRLICSMAQ